MLQSSSIYSFIHSFIHSKVIQQTFPDHQFCTRRAKFTSGSHVHISHQILTRDPGSQQAVKFMSGSQVFARELGSHQESRFIPKKWDSHQGARFLPGSVFRKILWCAKEPKYLELSLPPFSLFKCLLFSSRFLSGKKTNIQTFEVIN